MNILTGTQEFFGLDIGTTALRVVQLKGSGPLRALVRYAYLPIDAKTSAAATPADQQKLIQSIKTLLSQSKITARNVAVGLPSQKVFTTVVDIDRLNPSELAKTIQYQADSLIPTPIEQSKIDWALLGDSPNDKSKVEVLISSVTNDFAESRLDMLESIGLNVIAFEPDSMALARAVVPAGNTSAQMILDIGRATTDLIVIMNGAPRLTRAITTGADAIIKSAMQNLSIDEKQAQQFVFKFGLSQNKLEGQIYRAIIGTVDTLVNEIEKSIKFFQSRYPSTKLEHIIVTGGASVLPEFPLYVANRFGINVEIGNAWRNVTFPPEQQNDLLTVSNQFGVAVGLAERNPT